MAKDHLIIFRKTMPDILDSKHRNGTKADKIRIAKALERLKVDVI